VAELEKANARISTLEQQRAADAEQIGKLEAESSGLKKTIADLSAAVESLQKEIAALKPRNATTPQKLPATRLDSLIMTDFSITVLGEFQKKRFALLWRGTRDGFHADQFHRRCDGHANTLTVIMDVGGYVFGGFTPLAWDSSSGYKQDPSLRSFLFSLKSPSGSQHQKFSLPSQTNAIYCNSGYGPTFGGGFDIYVVNNSDGNTNSSANLGHTYTNHTGKPATAVFTGSQHFRAKEIEVFEITD
jgi:hypothetical protein